MFSWLIWTIIAVIPGVILLVLETPKRTVTTIYIIFCVLAIIGWAIYSKFHHTSTDGANNS